MSAGQQTRRRTGTQSILRVGPAGRCNGVGERGHHRRIRRDHERRRDCDAAGRDVPRLALSISEACEAIGVSWDFWRQHVESDVSIVRLGRRKLVPVSELERWLTERAETV
jgi:hypothetical protein